MLDKIVMGLWPIAGITTVGVTSEDARATLSQAIDSGITTFDTAFSYGFDGESDRLLGELVSTNRSQFRVFGKVGQRWNSNRERIVDASPGQLIADAEVSLERSGLDYFDILFLHSPDPDVPIGESAAAIQSLADRGLCRAIGLCNMTMSEMKAFCRHAPLAAIQCPLNMIQSQGFDDFSSETSERGIDSYVFWTLMKGLLAGKIGRDHVFAEGDSRPNYAIFQGELRASIHDALDELRLLGDEIGQTLPQMAVGWAISQPGVTAALVGARHPKQVLETAGSKQMSSETLSRIARITQRARALAAT